MKGLVQKIEEAESTQHKQVKIDMIGSYCYFEILFYILSDLGIHKSKKCYSDSDVNGSMLMI